MFKNTIDVLIVDDSALMRKMVSEFLDSVEGINPKATAINGKFALERLKKDTFDVIILDLEMPEVDGIAFLEEFRKLDMDIPVIILSSFAKKGAEITFKALSLGAKDFITKPSGPISLDLEKVRNQIIEKVLLWGTKKKEKRSDFEISVSDNKVIISTPEEKITFKNPPIYEVATLKKITPEIVAIGISTGGPPALRKFFSDLNPDFPLGIIVAQHMPELFTKEFANSLQRSFPHFEIIEGSDYDEIKKGRIIISPGGKHTIVDKIENKLVIRVLPPDSYKSSFRPSVDFLFESLEKAVGPNGIGIIMTGMGADGAKGLKKWHNTGAITIAQDEESSTIFGMPKSALKLGAVDFTWNLSEMAENLSTLIRYLGVKNGI